MQRTTSASAAELAHRHRRRSRVDRDTREATRLPDRAQRAVSVRVGLDVDGDAVGARAGELLDVVRSGASIIRCTSIAPPASCTWSAIAAADERPDRDRRHEVAVHHVDVDHPRTGVHHLGDLRAELREVGREDRRAPRGARPNEVAGRSPSAHTGRSIEWPQCWQSMSSVVLIRTIVWCSPQFGHCETSS